MEKVTDSEQSSKNLSEALQDDSTNEPNILVKFKRTVKELSNFRLQIFQSIIKVSEAELLQEWNAQNSLTLTLTENH